MKTTTPKWTAYLSEPVKKEVESAFYLGRNVSNFRRYRWFSQEKLASKANTTQRIISEIESWDYNPTLDMIARIADALNLKVEILFKKWINFAMLEILDYFMSKLGSIDILKAMKLMYFTDLEHKEKYKHKLTNIKYYRFTYGPFSDTIYQINDLFTITNKEYSAKHPVKNYIFLDKQKLQFLDDIIHEHGKKSSKLLMKQSYETEPMKKLWAKLGWVEGFYKVIL